VTSKLIKTDFRPQPSERGGKEMWPLLKKRFFTGVTEESGEEDHIKNLVKEETRQGNVTACKKRRKL